MAFLQNAARRNGIRVDKLRYSYVVNTAPDMLENVCEEQDGIAVTLVGGLTMEGGRWDVHTCLLEDCRPGELLPAFPPVAFVVLQDPPPQDTTGIFPCPLYRTRSRRGHQLTNGSSTNLVTTIDLRAISMAFWVLRGAALLCEV